MSETAGVSLTVDDEEERALLLMEFSFVCANAAVVLLLDVAVGAAGVAADAKAPPCETRGREEDFLLLLPLPPDNWEASTCCAVVALVGTGRDDEEPASKGGAAAPWDD